MARMPGGGVLPMTSKRLHQKSVKVWKDELPIWDCGEEWHKALTQFLGRPANLVEMLDSNERWLKNPNVNGKHPISFADAEPILLVNQKSVELVEVRMSLNLGALRFRPNIVVDGLDPFKETQILRWTCRDVEFVFSKLCSRCVVITLNPASGEKQYPELLKDLAKDQLIDGKIRFGVHIVPTSPLSEDFVLSVGDEFLCS